jgi:hypothetical protein
MKVLYQGILMFLVLFNMKPVEAQTGWIQTQINPGIGYNLTTTDSVLYASTLDGVFSTESDGMPWFSKGLANRAAYDVIKTETSILAATVDGIYRSVDEGNNWSLVSNSIKCSGVGGTQGNQVFAGIGNYLFIHTWGQGIFRSADDGLTWQLLTAGTTPGYSGDLGGWATCIYAFDGKIFIGAPGGDIGIYYSSDNGNTWNQAKSGSAVQYNDLLFFYAEKDTIYAGGFWGLFRSIDKGMNWVPQYRNMVNSVGQMVGIGTFRDMVSYGQNLIAAIDSRSIQISIDRGLSWADFNTGIISDWTFAALEIKPPYIWALRGFFGNAYRRPITDLVTLVKPDLSIENNVFDLEQNFPNPVKYKTTIKYKMNQSEKVELTVFDIFGKEIVTIVNSIQPAGEYEISFNAKNLNNGTYFYRLNAGNNLLTRKFQVLH